MNGLPLLRTYVRLQARLIARLRDEVGDKLPKRAQVQLDGTPWRFRRHGSGGTFICERDRREVAAHDFPLEHPNAFDAWRVLLYCESIGVVALRWQGRRLPVEDEQQLRAWFKELEAAGVIRDAGKEDRELWVLADD